MVLLSRQCGLDIEMQKQREAGEKFRIGPRLRSLQRGAALLEYVLLASLIAVVGIGAVSLTGNSVRELLDDSVVAIQAAFNNENSETDHTNSNNKNSNNGNISCEKSGNRSALCPPE